MTAKMTAVSRDETEMREAFKVFDRNGDGKENVTVSNEIQLLYKQIESPNPKIKVEESKLTMNISYDELAIISLYVAKYLSGFI